jgi:hypothetical protein
MLDLSRNSQLTGYQEEAVSQGLLLFPWVSVHGRPGSGGQSPPRVRVAMAMSASALW